MGTHDSFSEKDLKSSFYAIIGSGEALPTLMAEDEGILNGRPLTLNSGMQSYRFRIFDC